MLNATALLNEEEVTVPEPKDSITYFLAKNQIKTEDGFVLDFHDHTFMIDIYEEMALFERDIAGLKGAQVTFSTTAINAVLWLAKHRGINIIYTLPTFEDVRQFSGGKINRIIAQNPAYQEWVKEKDTVEQKVVGNNIIFFRGTHTQKAAMMVSSDLNVYDEIDASNQEVIAQYSTRLQHSKYKREYFFSHPSVPGNGVDKPWQRSDQKHWFVKCGACNEWQYLDWPESIDPKRGVYQCKKCQAEITDDMRREGQWVRKYKDREISGYWIPLLICPWVPATEVLKYHREKPADYFYNKVLGLPFVGGGNIVQQHEIYQNLTQEVHKQSGRIVIGVDTGIKLRYVIGDDDGLFYYGECDDYDELEKFLKRWSRAIMVMDRGGDIIGPRKLQEKYPGRVFLATYVRDKDRKQLFKWGEHDESGTVQIARNDTIQYVVDHFREKRIPLHFVEKMDDWYDYWLHFNHIYRISDEDKVLHRMVYRWERSDRDDWVHATVYWMAGIQRFGAKGSIVGAFTDRPEPNSYEVTPDDRTSRNPLEKVTKLDQIVFPDEQAPEDWRT